MKSWQYQRLLQQKNSGFPKLYVSEGKLKGRSAVPQGVGGGSKFIMKFEDVIADIHYTALEEVDEFGRPKILPVVDMTGRAIEVGSTICFSGKASSSMTTATATQNSYSTSRNSHSLQIGRVIEITRIGSPVVETIVRNGEKVKADTWRKNRTTINDPMRTLKLPVDDESIIMWMLQDYEDMGKQA